MVLKADAVAYSTEIHSGRSSYNVIEDIEAHTSSHKTLQLFIGQHKSIRMMLQIHTPASSVKSPSGCAKLCSSAILHHISHHDSGASRNLVD
jgi:hypothetical protein